MNRSYIPSADFKGPNFIGVGAPRAGTTWLYELLRVHPELWMPPIKELHYFDSLDPSQSLHRKTQSQRFRIKRYAILRLKHYLASYINFLVRKNLFDKSVIKTDLAFDYKFFGPGENLDWYKSLFETAADKGLISGEFTPDYGLMQPNLAMLLPQIRADLKVILMLRDPVERTWSNAVFYVTRRLKIDINTVSIEQWIEYCFRPQCLDRSDYLRMYNTLIDVLPKEQIFIGFFDEVELCPQLLVNNVLEFLGAKQKILCASQQLNKNVNGAAKIYKNEIPPAVKLLLARHFVPELEKLLTVLESKYISMWLISHKKLIAD